jgi:hypothetical protein
MDIGCNEVQVAFPHREGPLLHADDIITWEEEVHGAFFFQASMDEAGIIYPGQLPSSLLPSTSLNGKHSL